MKIIPALVLSTAAVHAVPVSAQVSCVGQSTPCEELPAADRQDLIAKLQKAQQDLKSKRWVPFTLLSGSMASDGMTNVAPREAFLKVDFSKAQSFKRIRTTNKFRRSYRIAYVDGSHSIGPMGRVPFFWEIDVVLSFDAVTQVNLLYRAPDPH